MDCPKCAGRTLVVRTLRKDFDLTVRVRACQGCGVVFRTRETPEPVTGSKPAGGHS